MLNSTLAFFNSKWDQQNLIDKRWAKELKNYLLIHSSNLTFLRFSGSRAPLMRFQIPSSNRELPGFSLFHKLSFTFSLLCLLPTYPNNSHIQIRTLQTAEKITEKSCCSTQHFQFFLLSFLFIFDQEHQQGIVKHKSHLISSTFTY